MSSRARLSARARCMLGAGVLAGSVTAAAALFPASSARVEAATIAHRTADAAPAVTPELIEEELASYEAARWQAAAEAERALRSQPRASRASGRRPFVVPAAGARTGWFGERRGSRGHVGIDIDGGTGDPVWAAGPGVVAHAGPAPAGYSGYGLIVAIDHGDGVTTVYAHLSRVGVAAGAAVDTRSLLGAIGTSGRVTGSHLHFEVRVDGHPVDPADWLD